MCNRLWGFEVLHKTICSVYSLHLFNVCFSWIFQAKQQSCVHPDCVWETLYKWQSQTFSTIPSVLKRRDRSKILQNNWQLFTNFKDSGLDYLLEVMFSEDTESPLCTCSVPLPLWFRERVYLSVYVWSVSNVWRDFCLMELLTLQLCGQECDIRQLRFSTFHSFQETEHCSVFQLPTVIEKTHAYTLYTVCTDYSFFSLVLTF